MTLFNKEEMLFLSFNNFYISCSHLGDLLYLAGVVAADVSLGYFYHLQNMDAECTTDDRR